MYQKVLEKGVLVLPVSSQNKKHAHQWQRTTRHFEGATIFFHVCVEHSGENGKIVPVVKAYHMEKSK